LILSVLYQEVFKKGNSKNNYNEGKKLKIK